MDIQKKAVREYLVDGIPYRALAKKYGVSRSTINKWVLVHPGRCASAYHSFNNLTQRFYFEVCQ